MSRFLLSISAACLLAPCLAPASAAPLPATTAAQSSPARNALSSADSFRTREGKEALEQAADLYRRSLDLATAEALPEVQALARLGIGLSLSLLGQAEDSVPFLREATDVLRTLGNQPRLAEGLVALATAFQRVGDNPASVRAIVEALAIAEARQDRRLRAQALAEAPAPLADGRSLRALREEAVAIQRSLGADSALASALNELGFLVTEAGLPKEAMGIHEEALAVARRANAPRQAGTALSLFGYAKYRAGDYVGAIPHYRESLPFSRQAGDRLQESYTLSALGLCLLYTGRANEALPLLRQTAELRRELKVRSLEGVSLHNIALALRGMGRAPEASDLFNQAIAVHRARGDRGEEAVTLLALAVMKEGHDEAGALDLASRALELARQVGDEWRETAALLRLGVIHATAGRYRDAIDQYQAAVDLAVRRQDMSLESQTERMLGQLYGLIGNRTEALAHFERTITRSTQPRERASALSQSAVIKAELGDLQDARRRLAEAQGLGGKIDHAGMKARLADSEAAVSLMAGDIRRAIQKFEEELAITRQSQDARSEASVLVRLGQAHALRRDRTRAQQFLDRGLTLSFRTRNGAAQSVALTELMRLWRDRQQPTVAAFFGKQAVNLFQQTRANLLQLDPAIQRTYVDSRAHVYRELADILMGSGRLSEAQQVLDLLKQEEYLDFVRRAGQQTRELQRVDLTRSEYEWATRYREIEQRVIELGHRHGELLAMSARNAAETRELEQVEADLTAANEGFLQALRRLAVDLGGRDARVSQLVGAQGLMPTLRELGAGTVAVYTLVTPTRYHAMLITADARKAVYTRISAETLSRLVFRFREALQSPAIDPRPLAAELYGVMIRPLARDLEQARATTVLWVLDGVLRYVPVAALHDGQQYVAERYRSVVFTPAGNNDLKAASGATWTGIGAGVSQATAGFSALPAVSEELHEIFGSDSGQRAGLIKGRILLDHAFTADAFRAALRERAPLVHVASHFQFRPGNDVDSFLLLGDGSRLTVADLRRATNIFEGVELLTMSACNTAIGTSDARGEEFESFGAWAQLNGAKSVVASLWPVADASTRAFMQQFYRARVESRLSKADAMRTAQLALLRGAAGGSVAPQPAARPPSSVRGLKKPNASALPAFVRSDAAPWAHPYYWAPFILIGNFN